jgi:uncharacterized membrane protein (DUF4010 family)
MSAAFGGELEPAAGLLVAGLVGLAVGIEREWSGHASGPQARFAGVRTFLLLGLVGGVAGLLVQRGADLSAAVLLAGAAGLAVAAYAVAARHGGVEAIDGTTEAAALAVVALGTLAALGELRLAAGVGAVIVLALREKSAIQGAVRQVDDVELRAALQFAVLALVLLPILPEGPYGPWGGVRPRQLWIVVLLVSGLHFAGYVARRTVGTSRGAAVAGLIGGAISSTAVSLTFARQSRERPAEGMALALGVVGACTLLLPRLVLLTLTLSPALTLVVLPILLPPFLVGLTLFTVGLHRSPSAGATAVEPEHQNPLRLGQAILLALGFQAVLTVMVLVRERFGDVGVLASSGLLGLTDMDALTLSLSRQAAQPELIPLAALGMGIGVASNTLLKLGVVLTVGAGTFRRRAGAALALLLAAALLGLWIGIP